MAWVSTSGSPHLGWVDRKEASPTLCCSHSRRPCAVSDQSGKEITRLYPHQALCLAAAGAYLPPPAAGVPGTSPAWHWHCGEANQAPGQLL